MTDHPELKDLENTILTKYKECGDRIINLQSKFYDAEIKLHGMQVRIKEVEEQARRLAEAFKSFTDKDIEEYAERHK